MHHFSLEFSNSTSLLSCEMFDLSIFDVRCCPGKLELVEVCIAPDTKLADISGKNL